MTAFYDAKPITFRILTFGCQMNVHDSEHIAGVLLAAGFEESKDDTADVIIFNTCSVREKAEQRVLGKIRSIVKADSGGPLVAVGGCMAQRLGSRILRTCPNVDLVFGIGSIAGLPDLLRGSAFRKILDLGDSDCPDIDSLECRRTSTLKAWVPVSRGCDNYCSYCIVPYVRGPERCRPPAEILREVSDLACEGVVEVTLLGQNVNSYGSDLDNGFTFAELLDTVAAVEGITRIKFETSHPRDLSDRILEVMARRSSVCNHLHLPAQSGSDRVLRAMGRGYDRDYYLERVAVARSLMPDLVLTTDLMVGFPTETESDFEKTMELVELAAFDSAYTFIYSQREGTGACHLEGGVPVETARRRLVELCSLQRYYTGLSLKRMAGRTVEVLVGEEAPRGGFNTGRTRGHRVVLVSGQVPVDSLVKVEVTAAGEHSLRGRVLEFLACASPQTGG
jgi:tRNA-2-methylthio-N6-dimethylallyladenosine synthase